MEKNIKCLIFDNHNWEWNYPKDPDNYFFGFVQDHENDRWEVAWKDERKRMLVVNINQSIIDNFQSQYDMALFVLETLNNEKWTIYLE